MSDPNINNHEELRKIFSIACDVYGLNPHQLWHINRSIDVLNDVVFDFKAKEETKYIEKYNILAKLLNNVQTAGNVFNLEDAGKVFKSLNTIKTFLETKEMTDDLDTSYQFIKVVVNQCFFNKLFYSFDQIDKLVTSLDILSGIHLEKYKDERQLDRLAFIREMIELAQNKGKFSLDQANSIIEIITNIKRNIIRYNVDKDKEEKEKEKNKETKETKINIKEPHENDSSSLLGTNEIIGEEESATILPNKSTKRKGGKKSAKKNI